MDELAAGSAWYCVRTVFRFHRASTAGYEERLTLWRATAFSAATASAEAYEYACLYEPVSAPAIELLLAPPHRVPRPFGPTCGLRVLLCGALLAWSRWGQKKFAQWGQLWFFETYADSLDDCAYVGLAQAYALSEAPEHGKEVFSLMRDSTLAADANVSAFFDTGTERQGNAFES